MRKKKSSRVSIRDIAQAAGVSKTSVGYALHNRSKVSRVTRDRILRIARKMGYAPDARMATMMTGVRSAKAKELLPIAWLNSHFEKDAWHKYKYLSPYLEGARERSLQLGYRLEEIWLLQPNMTRQRISQIIDQRGIEGIIVTYYVKHFRLNWDHLAGVSLEGTVVAPRLHRVTTDTFFNFLLAIKMLKRNGYERIGVCLEQSFDSRTHQGIRAMMTYLEGMLPKAKRVPPFFYLGESEKSWRMAKDKIVAWLHRYQPDVIVAHSNRLVQLVEEAGYRVPEDIGIVHLATDDDVSDWAGIFSNKKAAGIAAVELVISLIQNRQFGIPETALHTMVEGTWHPGCTLLTPKPK